MSSKAERVILKQSVSTTCCYCGVGCGVVAQLTDNHLDSVRGDDHHPANQGRLCVKGSSLHETQTSKDRLLVPRVHGRDTDWDTALGYVAERFSEIIAEHGPDAVAFYLSGQLLTEDYYVANKLMKGFIGTANVDTNSRLCMASAVVAHKRAFGSDIVPGCYEDLELADLLLIVGSNAAYAHPVLYQRVVKAKQERPEMKIVVIDPRRTATCEIADYHLALKPGSDAFFFNGLLAYLAANDALDQTFIEAHCDGFKDALSSAEAQVPSAVQVSDHCDISAELIETVYQLFASTEKSVTMFSQGINQSSSGVDKGNAIINCHLATGKIGKVGAAPFSITGQPNAMGGREVGGLANQLAAHMDFDPKNISRVAHFWRARNMVQREGLKAVDMFKAVDSGQIKAIWIMATNPVVTMPDADRVKQALQKCDLVVVSECASDTDTAVLADVLLPATTWGEKNGTVTNSERCISLQKGFLSPPGQALNDWDIISRFARRMGFDQAFDYSHPAQIFREHAALSALENSGSRGFDIGGMQDINDSEYQNLQPIQWPVTPSAPQGSRRLFSDGKFFTSNGRARFIAIEARAPVVAARVDQVIMNTGRVRDQWHTMSRTGVAAKLLGHVDEPYIDVNPGDLERFKLRAGELAVLQNRGAKYFGRVKRSSVQRAGEVFVPMHWNDKYASSSRVDALVNDVVDPICGQPEFKHSPVEMLAFDQAWHGFLLCLDDIRPASEYWAKITLNHGLKYRLADGRLPEDWSQWLTLQFPHIREWAEVRDSARHFYRAAGYRDGVLQVVVNVAAGYKPVQEVRWLEDQLGTLLDSNARFAVLAGMPTEGIEDIGSIICSCFQVGDKSIRKAIAAGCSSTDMLGKALNCGTNCGSCIPELNAILNSRA